MFKRKVEQDGATATPGQIEGDASGLDLEVKGGYVFDFGLFAGLHVLYQTGKQSSVLGSANVKTFTAGPSVGYHEKNTNLLLTATYHLVGNTDLDSAGKYDSARGLQVDLLYPIQLTEKINIGPQITWRGIKETDGSTGLADTKTKEFVPSVTAWFYF